MQKRVEPIAEEHRGSAMNNFPQFRFPFAIAAILFSSLAAAANPDTAKPTATGL
jgi:hypothetical protein